MSDWNSIWQGIGQLGETKKNMLAPVIEARRNRGKVWSEGLGKISDTIGGIADKRYASKEADKQRGFERDQDAAKEGMIDPVTGKYIPGTDAASKAAEFKPPWKQQGYSSFEEWRKDNIDKPIWQQYDFPNREAWEAWQVKMAELGSQVDINEDNIGMKFTIYQKMILDNTQYASYFTDEKTGLTIPFKSMSPETQEYLTTQFSNLLKSETSADRIILENMWADLFMRPAGQDANGVDVFKALQDNVDSTKGLLGAGATTGSGYEDLSANKEILGAFSMGDTASPVYGMKKLEKDAEVKEITKAEEPYVQALNILASKAIEMQNATAAADIDTELNKLKVAGDFENLASILTKIKKISADLGVESPYDPFVTTNKPAVLPAGADVGRGRTY